MAIDFQSAVDSILTTLNTQWAANAGAYNGNVVPALVFEPLERDMKPHPSDTSKPWARVAIRHADGPGKATLQNAVKQARYRRTGYALVQVFVPATDASGWGIAQSLAVVAQKAYEGKGGDVVYTKATVLDRQAEANFYRYDMRAEFYWDEIK